MLLEIKNLEISYGTKVTVSDANLELEKGEILSIVGESGSGKTTIIRAAMGCLPGAGRVSAGSILYEGKDVLQNTKEQWRKMSGTEMSMIFQDSGNMINPIRKIGVQFIDYIRTHAPEKSADEAYKMATEMLKNVRLPSPDNIMNSYPFELSGGMRQRVGIAMAMVFQPKILMADEPTSALDVTTQAQIIRQIIDVRDQFGVAVIIVTHNLGVASYMSDKIMVMKSGRPVDYGYRDEVLNNPKSDYTKNLLKAVPVIGGVPYYGQ